MQFLTEDGDCHRRNGNLGLALKRYFAVQKIFNEIEDDQYDFHGYSMRKFTLNVYMEFVCPRCYLSRIGLMSLAASSAGRTAFGHTLRTSTLLSRRHKFVSSSPFLITVLTTQRRYMSNCTMTLRCPLILRQLVRRPILHKALHD